MKLPALHRGLRLATALLLILSPARAERTLKEAAETVAGQLPAGGLVIGERIADRTEFAEFGNPEPAGIPARDRLFEIGSISKVFTGLLLAIAVEEGKVRFDSTLAELTGLEFADPAVGRITLLQLSTHTSGLPRLPTNLAPDPDALADPYAGYDRAKLDTYLRDARLEGEKPFPVAYSNLGTGLLGDLLSRIYDQPWDDLIRDKITGPLGMKSTGVTPETSGREMLAPPHRGADQVAPWTFQSLAGAGALRSTAEDLLTFGQAFIHPDETPLAAAIKAVMKPRADAQPAATSIGLGIFISKIDGEFEYAHSGGTGGYRSVLQIIPSRHTVRVVLINNDAIPAEAVLGALREEPASEPSPLIEMSGQTLEKFTGVYEVAPGSRFTVLRVRGKLLVRLSGQTFLVVEPIANDRFRYRDVAAEIRFTLSGETPDAMVLHQNGREIPAKRSGDPPAGLTVPTADVLKPYVGTYQLAPGAVFTLSVKGDPLFPQLFAQLTNQPALPVFMTADDHFEYDGIEAAIDFQRDPDGGVSGLILRQNGDHHAPRIEEK